MVRMQLMQEYVQKSISTTLPRRLSMDRGSLLTHSWVPANSGAQLPISTPLVPSQGGAGVAVGCGVPAGSGVAVGPGVAEGSGVDVAVGVAVGAGATVDAAAVGSGAAVAVAGSGVGVGVVAGSGAIVGAWGACVGGTCVAVGRGVGVASSPPHAESTSASVKPSAPRVANLTVSLNICSP